MNEKSIEIGTVVRDSFGREGIVCSKEETPNENWINEQVGHEALKNIGTHMQWWGIMPFGGGYLLCPSIELIWIRFATYEDFLTLADTAGIHGRKKLVKIFPHFVKRLLQERNVAK